MVMLFAGVRVSAQENLDPECIKYLSYYKEYYKQKSYDMAIPSWRKAFAVCPANTRETVYTEGAALYRNQIIKNRNNIVLKEALIDTLLMLHDMRAANYPKSAVKAYEAKGKDVFNYFKEEPARLYSEVNKIIDAVGVDTYSSLFIYKMNAAVKLYENGEMSKEDVLNDYVSSSDLLDKIISANPSEANMKSKDEVDRIFANSGVAECDDLKSIFEPIYSADPSLDNAKKVVNTFRKVEGCMNNDLFINALTLMHKSEPSHTSAYTLYRLNSQTGDVEAAIAFIEEAISRDDSDAAQDAQYNYELAVYSSKNGRQAKAYYSALKAAEDASLAGKAYFLCGQIWMGQRSGGDEITSRGPLFVAYDYFSKAKAADESLAAEATKLMGQCSAYFPATADAFMYGYSNGQGMSVSANGMTASTTMKLR